MSVLYAALFLVVPAQSQNSVEELMSSGNNLLRNGAFTEAASAYKQVLSKEPRNSKRRQISRLHTFRRSGTTRR